MLSHGLLVISAGRNTLRVIPPLNITREELDEGLEILEEAVAKVDRFEGHGESRRCTTSIALLRKC